MSMAMLTLTMLGGFEARAGSRAIALPRKAQALLAYLALAPTPTPSPLEAGHPALERRRR
jgi:hypothetical protein